MRVLRSHKRFLTYSAPASSLNYCVHLVRDRDRERYLCNLHAPASARPGLFAIHAFNVETAQIRNSNTQSDAGFGRMTWWRHALDQSVRGKPPDHPVAQAIADAHARYSLTTRYLSQLLDARETDMRVRQPQTCDHLRQYSERTAGSLLLLGLECAGVAMNDSAERAASHAGTALGLATLLRGTAAHAAQGSTYLPTEVTDRHQVSLTQLLRGTPSPNICNAVAEIADEAVSHLLAARSMQQDVPSQVRPILLPATVADLMIRRLTADGYCPFAPGAMEPLGLRLQISLLIQRLKGTF
jgi:NADH dehydrogenase [ubiquinone] 1 alpha subcomplex assembly factor 6